MIEVCGFLTVLVVTAVVADLMMDRVRHGPPPPGINWLAASGGAAVVLAPWAVLALMSTEPDVLALQLALAAGAVGAVVDLPLSVRRNRKSGRSLGRTLVEVIALGAVTVGLVYGLIETRQLEDNRNWGALG